MANTLASFRDSESWFPHDADSDVLVIGDRDQTRIPERLAERLDDAGRHSTYIYGWPTLVAMDRMRRPVVAPLFVVSVRPEKDNDKWLGLAESEPEFNLSVVAGELFDLSMKDEVEGVVGEGVPFGDAPSLVRLARRIARVLGTDVISALDPRSLARRCDGTLGLHNAAVWVRTDERRNAFGSLLDELEKLAHRRDWMETAAACLIPDRPPAGKPVHRSPTERLAAPVPCNDSQECTLERIRRDPLTVVTGPPGTGKTQLVVNAVANAWLDRETVLVASTNNGAVDVAVERANDICSGMLLRTGRRRDRVALAGRASEAVAAATDREGEPDDDLNGVAREAQARAELARTAERWARLVADLAKVAELSPKLAKIVGDLEKHAQAIWKRARAPESTLDSERIEHRARRLKGAWFFRRWRTRRLLKSVGCEDSSVSLGVLARWAAIDQERIALVADLAKVAELSPKLAKIVGDLEKHAQAIWKRARAPESTLDSERIEHRARRLKGAWFFRRWRTRRLLRSVGCEDPSISLGVLARWAAIDQERIALMNDLSATQDRIGDPDASVRQAAEQWSAASGAAAFETVGAGFRGGKSALQALNHVNPGGKLFAKTLRRCLRHARGWACTALSIQRNFPLEPRLFDLAIIDEASQCSLAVALPLAYRAKRLAVIGDPNQLTPIVTLPDGRLRAIAASERLDDNDLVDRGLHYKEGSAYRAFECAVERDQGQPVVLDEHYRSHPYIARWFNREFYGGALTVLTDTAGMSSDERSIGWFDVRGEARRGATGSWVNAAEAEAAVHRLAEWIHDTGGSVGVVTPFAAQALLIRRLAHRHPQLGDEVLTEVDFECGTAHRFQGAERDTIIFSAVLAPGIARRTASWVERERNLVNVAVSRAKRSLMVIGHPEIGTAGSPTLASLRSYLVEAPTRDDEAEHSPSAKFRTDSESEARLLTAMRNAGMQPSAKLFIQGYELDFALLEQGVRLNVEVDGDHHTDARGKLRRQDIARDRILAKAGWEIIRIPAWRCIWDPDAAAREIRLRLDAAQTRARQAPAQ